MDFCLLLYSCFLLVVSNCDSEQSNVERLSALTLSNNCKGKEDGDYWLLLDDSDSNYEPVLVSCQNEYIILDISKSGESLYSYFSSFEKWHTELGSPANHNPVNWQDWFLPLRNDENSLYLISPDCNSCDESQSYQLENTNTAYYMTGNIAKIFWDNVGFSECDFDTNTYDCYYCQSCTLDVNDACLPQKIDINDNSGIVSTSTFDGAGACGTAIENAKMNIETLRRRVQAFGTRPHYKPSIGTNGRFCMCYKPDNKYNNNKYILNHKQSKIYNNKIIRQDKETLKLQNILSNGVKINNIDTIDNIENEVEVLDIDKRKSNIIYLKQNDFKSGTYRILESGTYILSEDIILSFNNNENDDYWPNSDQSSYYIGANSYRDSYCMGFFAGITIESNYVTIDLNGYSLSQSYEFYYKQRWFALIELNNQPFKPGQGPAFFGPYLISVSDITIKNGILGLTSHFAIHGNDCNNLIIENIHIRDFATHGMQLNGFNNLEMNNIEIGPSSSYEFLNGDFGHGRLVDMLMNKITDKMILNNVNLDEQKIYFDNRDNINGQTITDIHDELNLQMDMAFEYALKRGKYGLNDDEAEKLIYKEFGIINDPNNKLFQSWEKSKRLFIHKSGLPSASSITGMFLNGQGASAITYAKYVVPRIRSLNGKLNNIYIHDISHDFTEFLKLSGEHTAYATPWLTDFSVYDLFGDDETVYKLWLATTNMNRTKTPINDNDFRYVGSCLSDAYLSMAHFSDDWDILGFTSLWNDQTNLENVDEDGFTLLDWAFGKQKWLTKWRFQCNEDTMQHSGKGILGLRIDGSNNIDISNIQISNLYEHTKLGSDLCGEYGSESIPSIYGGHFKQREPMQTGFSGNNLQGISIISSTVNFKNGLIDVSNLQNDFSDSFGVSLWTSNNINVEASSTIIVNNINSGILLKDYSKLTYDSRPNRIPQACGFRLEMVDNDDTSYSEYFDSYLSFNNDNSYNKITINKNNLHNNNKNLISQNIFGCSINGNTYCFNNYNNKLMFGNYLSEDNTICETKKIEIKEQINQLKEYINITNNNQIYNTRLISILILIIAVSAIVISFIWVTKYIIKNDDEAVHQILSSSKLDNYGAVNV